MTDKLPWRADVLFRTGEEAQLAEDYEGARKHYEQALAEADWHVATRFNLGVTLLRLGRYDEAAERFEALLEPEEEGRWPAVRFPAVHNLALARWYQGRRDDAMALAHELALEALGERPLVFGKDERAFLDRVEGPSVALLAAFLESEAVTAGRPSTSGRAAPDRRALREALRASDWRASVAPERLAEYAREHHGDDPRTLYTLAGYRAQRDPVAARELLSSALGEELPLHEWAGRDPLMRPARPPGDDVRVEPGLSGGVSIGPIAGDLEEVRVAMALNGGVSLAIWMGGCVVELDAARRAHLGREPVDAAPEYSRRSVYFALCTAFRRRFVIDILSGASAGGLNGALLAGAIRARRRLSPSFVRGRWLDVGDFAAVLERTSNPAPRSLLRGEYFHDGLLDAFSTLLSGASADPAAVSWAEPEALDVKLDVTVTDLDGAPRCFIDSWGQPLEAREHRARFRFRDADDFTPELLATAARASASFPLAFAPWYVQDPHALALAGFRSARWTIDGGLLDNAPIRAALDLIPTRPGGREVRRFVAYLNADPPVYKDRRTEPRLRDVAGYTLQLPRSEPFVDQLEAVEEAVRSAGLTATAERPLLELDLGALRASAEALLPAYRRRRRLLSLEELIGQPGPARAAYDRLEGRQLPWIPEQLSPPVPGQWRWGVLPARRIGHLVLDLLREAVDKAEGDARAALLGAWQAIDRELQVLQGLTDGIRRDETLRTRLTDLAEGRDPDTVVADLGKRYGVVEADVAGAVRRIAAVARAAAPHLDGSGSVMAWLFGREAKASDELDDAEMQHFLERVLSIEVVRRAFSADREIETSQPIHFSQLTPFAPTPVLARRPLTSPLKLGPEQKLTGIRLGHFAAFYRRSWRANDFMWGRLDGAARVVDMLVDSERARRLGGGDDAAPWTMLARALLEDGAPPDQRGLVEEALADYPYAERGGDLVTRLEAALERDLTVGDASFTRIVATRAVQLEILAQEVPVLVEASVEDARDGSATPPLDLPVGAGMLEVVAALREHRPLPELLGRDEPVEASSTLALRSVLRALRVTLAAVRADGLPLARPLSGVGALFAPAAAAVARSITTRVVLLVGFWAASLYITARVVTTAERPGTIADLVSGPVLVGLIAAALVAGVVSVPALRAARSPRATGLAQLLWVLALTAAGGGYAVVAGAVALDHGPVTLTAGPGADDPPAALVWLVVVVAVALPLLRVVLARRATAWTRFHAWTNVLLAVGTLIASVLVGAWGLVTSVEALDEGTWRVVAGAVALVAAPALAISYLFEPFTSARSRTRT